MTAIAALIAVAAVIGGGFILAAMDRRDARRMTERLGEWHRENTKEIR